MAGGAAVSARLASPVQRHLKPQLVLASGSPRRRELLEGLGLSFVVEPANIDEAQWEGEPPADYVKRMAREKAAATAARLPQEGCVILASDTSVVYGEKTLGKPVDSEDARATLRLLSGKTHQVLTAVCLRTAQAQDIELVTTAVSFAPLSDVTIESYLETDEPWDKAGSYGIQGLAGAFVTRIEGSYSNVVGLPLAETRAMLLRFGVRTALDKQPAIPR